jgi:hypothetical protein
VTAIGDPPPEGSDVRAGQGRLAGMENVRDWQ